MASISIPNIVGNYNQNNKQIASTFPANYGSPSINMWFPADLSQGDNNPAFILFQFFEYQRPSLFIAPNLSPLGSIIFPMPVDLVDRIQLTYEQRENGSAVGAALDSFSAAASAKGSISNTLTGLAEHAATVGEGIGLGAATGAINTLGKIPGLGGISNVVPGGLQIMGLAQNPFLSVLFNAPQFKRFGMSWTFIPETPQDSTNLNFMIQKLKYHSLPDIAQNALFFTYPDIVVPTIYPTGFFFDFKRCVLENVVVNYVPGNTPGLFSGTLAPTAIQVTITLLEIELWVKSDIQPSSGSGAHTNQQTTPSTFTGANTAATAPVPGSPLQLPGATPPTPVGQPFGSFNNGSPVTPPPQDPLGSSVTFAPSP